MRLHIAHHDRPGLGDLAQQIRDRIRERVPEAQRERQELAEVLSRVEARRKREAPALPAPAPRQQPATRWVAIGLRNRYRALVIATGQPDPGPLRVGVVVRK